MVISDQATTEECQVTIFALGLLLVSPILHQRERCTLLAVVSLLVGVVRIAGYHCNYNVSGPVPPIRPEIGESGPILSFNYPHGYGPLRSFCEVHIEACYGCTIQVKFEEAALIPCSSNKVLASDTYDCGKEDLCEYFIWSEKGQPPLRLLGNLTSYVVRAQASVRLRFCYTGNIGHTYHFPHVHRWRAVFTVLDQFTYRVYGSARQSGPNPAPKTGILRSPGFPQRYPSEHTTYFIQGVAGTDRIRIVFDDFDIDPIASLLKIYDGPGRTEPGHTFRTRDERPVFTSSSEYVLIEFLPGERDRSSPFHMGFKATYEFILKETVNELPNPVQHKCAPVRPSEGGVMLQRGPNRGSPPVYHDCVWSLPTHHNLYMNVHIIDFKLSKVPFSRLPLVRQLEIRNAFHSDGKVLTILYSESQLPLLGREDLSSPGGLYVRLRATLSDDSIVRFSYAPFRREKRRQTLTAGTPCNLQRGATGFQQGVLCDNSTSTLWCIPSKLACDNFTHCKDASDEHLPICHGKKTWSGPVSGIIPTVRSQVSTCDPPLHRCVDGKCVRKVAECFLTPGSRCLALGMKICSGSRTRCYTENQRCDRKNDCGDWSDEDACDYDRTDHRLSVFVQSLGNTWFFFLPAGILILTFVIGCVIYKTRKFRRLANNEGYIGAAPSDDVQLHTFTATAPPPYEEIVPITTAVEAPQEAREECEPPPPYEEIAMEYAMAQDGAGAAAPPSAALQMVGGATSPGGVVYKRPESTEDGAGAAGAEGDAHVGVSEA